MLGPALPRLLLLLALLSISSPAGPTPSFRFFTMNDGLVRNTVTNIHRDSQGYLWFCTVEGVSLFDGYRFTNFSTRDGLPSRLVYGMVETPQGDFWFATNAGLAQFHKDHGKAPAFSPVRVGSSKESNDVHTLYQGHDGTLWSGTGAGLFRFRPQDGEAAPHPVAFDGPPPEVRALVEVSRRNLWVATMAGLFRRRPGGEVESWQSVFPGRFDALLVDARERLWLGGFRMAGLDTTSEPPRILPPNEIPDKTPGLISFFYQGDQGEIWIGKNTGLLRFRPEASPSSAVAYPRSDAFPIDFVEAVAQDVRHNLWLSVGTRGVIRIAAGSFELFTPSDGLASEVFGLVESSDGTLYAVTGQWTLNELQNDRFVPIPMQVPKPGYTWAVGQILVQDREGAWWAASGGGVARYAPVRNARELKRRAPERVYSQKDGLPSQTILRIFRDSRDDIWAGTVDGAAHWNRATGRWQGFPTAVLIPGATGRATVHSFAEDSSGAVWAGMYPGGLVRFRGSVSEPITRGVPRGAINALLSDRQGRLWIGSSQGGLGRMDQPAAGDPQIRTYGLEQGLSSEQIFSLVQDDAGRIYVADGRGVDRLDPRTTTLYHFTSSTGLPPGETQFLFRGREGNLWFASTNGLARYRPEPDQTLETPTPLLRALRVGDERFPISEMGVSAVEGMELSPGHSSLEVEFRALHFDIGAGLRYQYWLHGADAGWSRPTAEQTVRYANLAPGQYRFAVRSITESGAVSAGQATLGFEVLPVFWRRSWFLGLVILAAGSGAVSLHRYRLHHVVAMERVRTRLAADLHDDLGAGLAEIAILSEVARLQERPRTMELLESIAGRARSLREAMTDIVWTVDPREDSLVDLVLRLRQIAFSMLENDERSVAFVAPADEQMAIELAPDVRRHVLLFFKEVVTNVARHAGATAVRVAIEAGKGRLKMSVRDNGRGFDPQQPFVGHGLKTMRYRAAELHGRFNVQSGPESGTEIELTLPI